MNRSVFIRALCCALTGAMQANSQDEWVQLDSIAPPQPHFLASGPYVFGSWDAEQPAQTYPGNMLFLQTAVQDPALDVEMDSPWTLPYNLTNRSRINGLGADGLAFINTGNAQDAEGAGYLGAAVLALDTSEQQDIRVTWTGGTVLANSRVYGIRLQFRVGTEDAFQDVLDAGGNPVEYVRNSNDGHSEVIGPVVLPESADNQPRVEVRWKYHYISGDSGPRAQLRIDDILVSAGHPPSQKLAIVEAPEAGQTGRPLPAIIVQAQSEDGALATGYDGPIMLSLIGEPAQVTGTFTRTATAGVAVFDDLVFFNTGSWTVAAAAGGLASASHGPVSIVELTELLMPLYIQGEQPENNNRVPFAFRLQVSGLLPNATYRYANRIVIESDPPTQNGAGNMIFVKTDGAGFVRTTDSPRFRPEDMNSRHSEFQTDGSGSHTGWFITEPSGNSRFTPGDTVFVRLLLNDGMGGEEYHHFLTATTPVTVIEFGGGTDQASAFWGTTPAAPKDFLFFFDEAQGGRPLAGTVVEWTGAPIDERYAAFYESVVTLASGPHVAWTGDGDFQEGGARYWGALLPNSLAGGVRRIETHRLSDGEPIASWLAPGGIYPTMNPSGGLTPIGIRIPGGGDSLYWQWAAAYFALDELGDASVSGFLADADGDGILNFLKYALVLHPRIPSTDGLPSAQPRRENDTAYLEFEFRRRTDDPDLLYTVEISENLLDWEDAGAQLTWLDDEPGEDGAAIGIALLPLEGGEAAKFLRLKVAAGGG